MKKIALIFALLVIVFACFADAPKNIDNTPRPVFADDIIKIKLSEAKLNSLSLPQDLGVEVSHFGDPDLDAIMQKIEGISIQRAHRKLLNQTWERQEGFDRWFLITTTAKLNVSAAIEILKQNPHIELAIPERFAYTQVTPNDSYYAQNWGHNNTGQGSGGGGIGFDSNAPEAWDQEQGFGSPDIIIAIIDSGVNYNHPDLNDNCVPGHDYGSNDTNPMDSNGHGTSCAGVAAGETNNGIGVAGVAGGCKIMPIKVMNNNGSMTFTYITNGITHAADNGAHVLSMSLGAENGTDEGDDPACDAALYYANNAGCVIFAATANSNAAAIAYPANHTVVISVGAASPTGQRKSPSSSDGQNWWGSNYGVNIQDDPKSVDIMAATILPATTVSGAYSTDFNGTSCATPYAAGVAALILSKDPSLTPAQVRTVITGTATDMTIDGGIGWDRFTGYGMINANAALLSIVNGAPSCQIVTPANNSTHNHGSLINVQVNASDSEGSVQRVDFYIDDDTEPAFTDFTAPYEWNWNTAAYSPWAHTIRAKATDNENNSRQTSINVFLLAAADEGFESGNFTAYPWVQGGNNPWIIQSTDLYSGTFAAKAGTITHLQTSTLSVELQVSAAGEISFFNKVSSEAYYDYMRFYIDGVLQAQWSGITNWTFRSFPVNPGTRTFNWTYYKDQGVSSGSDTAWLDHIVFPPHGSAPAAPSNLVATALSPTKIRLTWVDNSHNETEFFIERLVGTTWNLIDWVGPNTNSFTINSLSPETNYSFRIKAVNGTDSSNYSNVSSAVTLDNHSPDNVLAIASANIVQLSWSAPIFTYDGYEIWRYRLVNGNAIDPVLLTPTGLNANNFTDHSWRMLASGDYVWKVSSLLVGYSSVPSISNILTKTPGGTIQGSVTNLSGTPIYGAQVGFDGIYATTDSNGIYSLALVPGTYNISATHSSYQAVEVQDLALDPNQNLVQNFLLPLGTVSSPLFSPQAGSYNSSVEIHLSCDTEAAQIRYTLDNSVPDANSTLYTGPFLLQTSSTVRAIAFKLNYIPSDIAIASYEISTGSIDENISAIAGIHSIYPNPFNDTAKIRMNIKDGSQAYTVSIYNIKGELVYRTSDRHSGELFLSWNGKDGKNRRVSPGIYLLRFEQGKLSQTRKLIMSPGN